MKLSSFEEALRAVERNAFVVRGERVGLRLSMLAVPQAWVERFQRARFFEPPERDHHLFDAISKLERFRLMIECISGFEDAALGRNRFIFESGSHIAEHVPIWREPQRGKFRTLVTDEDRAARDWYVIEPAESVRKIK